MKNSFFNVLIVLTLFSFSYINEENFETYKSFQDGETITYTLYYNLNFVWVPAGEVEFSVKEEANSYHVTAKGKTYETYNWFYKVNDRYDSYIDKKTLLPIMSIRDIQEGNYKLYDKLIYDQKKLKAISYRGQSATKTEKKEYTLKEPIFDVLSIVYYIRSLDYSKIEKGTKIPIRIFLDEEYYPLNVKFEGVTKKDVKGLGNFNSLHLTPEVVAGNVFKNGDKMKIWAGNDLNHLPLMIETPISVGSIKVVLKECKG